MGHYNGNLQFQCELHYVPSSLFLTDAIWQVKADKCDCKWLNAHFKNNIGIFFCSHPKGFGCAAQKEHERKALSCVFATKTRESVHLSNGTDTTSGMSPSGTSLFIHIPAWSRQALTQKLKSVKIVSVDRDLSSLVEACWSKVITERQQMLEEAYKMEMSASHRAQTGAVSMSDISPLWEEMAHKAWLLHIG